MKKTYIGFDMPLDIPEEFAEAIRGYYEIILQNYTGRTRDIESATHYVQEIKDIYTNSQPKDRIHLLYFTLKGITKGSFPDEIFGNWCRKLAIQLVDELEKIQ